MQVSFQNTLGMFGIHISHFITPTMALVSRVSLIRMQQKKFCSCVIFQIRYSFLHL